jgi:uncharacterized protein YndB with AHSA1/START domain
MSEITTRDGGFTVTTEFAATPEELFDAWLDPEVLKHWLATESEIDARVGGRYVYRWPSPDGEFSARGEYLELVPGKRLVQTWESWGPDGRIEGADATVTVEFHDLGHGRASMAQTETSEIYRTNPQMAKESSGGAIAVHEALASYLEERT